MTDAAFYEFDAEDFPFRIETYDQDTGEVYWSQCVREEGALSVPPKPKNVRRIWARIYPVCKAETTDPATSEPFACALQRDHKLPHQAWWDDRLPHDDDGAEPDHTWSD